MGEQVTRRHVYRHGKPLIRFDRTKMTLVETLYHRYRRLRKEARLAALRKAKGPRPIKRHHHFITEPVHIHFNRNKVHHLMFY